MADEPPDPPLGDDQDRDDAERLAEEFAERLRRGEHPTIDEYVARRPDLEETIRSLFPSIALVERIAEEQTTVTEASTPATRGFRLTRKVLGDFEILREIGRGGMGVVYEAQQQSLNRRVALKVLAPSVSASPRQLRRFQREAESAARLHHTNIVQIYGTGEDDGLHFYAMQLIEGVSFRDVIDTIRSSIEGEGWDLGHAAETLGQASTVEGDFTAAEATTAMLRRSGRARRRARTPNSTGAAETPGRLTQEPAAPDADKQPTRDAPAEPAGGDATGRGMSVAELLEDRPEYWRRVAKVGISVASALSYSHQEGILHRDIKPSNVLLDRKGIVWVADFGLAKHEGHQGVTSVGDIVGTIRYMAPEQFSGRADSRSDVHSLGLMLYEMLTLRPAFTEDRHGPLIRQKMAAAPPPPRTLVPHVPADLETIVRKACALNPEDRYANAAELEADLKRFLDGRPIHARRVPLLERTWRWARRNPLSAVLSTWLALVVLAGVVLFAVGKHRTDQALDQLARQGRTIATKEAAAAAATIRAAENVRVAVAGFEGVMRNLASRSPGDWDVPPTAAVPSGASRADEALLEDLLASLKRFPADDRGHLADAKATALLRLGRLQTRLGTFRRARESLQNSIGVYDAMAGQANDQDRALSGRARAWNALGEMRRWEGDLTRAREAHETARGLLEQAVAAPSASATVRFELAHTLVQAALAEAEAMRGRPPSRLTDKPVKDCTRATELLAVLRFEEPQRLQYRLAMARANRAFAECALLAEHTTRAAGCLRGAVEELERLVGEHKQAPGMVYELALALACRFRGPDYAQRIARAATLSEGLVRDWPAVREYRLLAARCLHQQGMRERKQGQAATARERLGKALTYVEPLARQAPQAGAIQLTHAELLLDVADTYLATERNTGAAQPLALQARRILQALPNAARTSSRCAALTQRLRAYAK